MYRLNQDIVEAYNYPNVDMVLFSNRNVFNS